MANDNNISIAEILAMAPPRLKPMMEEAERSYQRSLDQPYFPLNAGDDGEHRGFLVGYLASTLDAVKHCAEDPETIAAVVKVAKKHYKRIHKGEAK